MNLSPEHKAEYEKQDTILRERFIASLMKGDIPDAVLCVEEGKKLEDNYSKLQTPPKPSQSFGTSTMIVFTDNPVSKTGLPAELDKEYNAKCADVKLRLVHAIAFGTMKEEHQLVAEAKSLGILPS